MHILNNTEMVELHNIRPIAVSQRVHNHLTTKFLIYKILSRLMMGQSVIKQEEI